MLRTVSGKKVMILVSGSRTDSTSLIGWRLGAWGGRTNDLVEAFGVDLWRCAGGKMGI